MRAAIEALALIQGTTEFSPVSGSARLLLGQHFFSMAPEALPPGLCSRIELPVSRGMLHTPAFITGARRAV